MFSAPRYITYRAFYPKEVLRPLLP